MITRKIWKGDLLNLAEGNSFFGCEVVHHRAGSCVVWQDSEEGDPLVEIDGGRYIVKRADLSELSEWEADRARAVATIMYAGLNGYTAADVEAAKRVLEAPPETQNPGSR
jgi:hypothetical protein